VVLYSNILDVLDQQVVRVYTELCKLFTHTCWLSILSVLSIISIIKKMIER